LLGRLFLGSAEWVFYFLGKKKALITHQECVVLMKIKVNLTSRAV